MHVFGLTGGIASGKSAVAARLRARGLPVIDADLLSRDVVAPGTPGLAALVEAFGASVLAASGELDRAALGQKVFADPEARRRMNAIVHPRIAAASAEAIAALSARGEPLACYEAALLVENGLADAFRPLVVVAASPDVQLARMASRDGLDEASAKARLAAQVPLEDKVRAADVVITNEGSREELTRATDHALEVVLARVGVDPVRYPRPA